MKDSSENCTCDQEFQDRRCILLQ